MKINIFLLTLFTMILFTSCENNLVIDEDLNSDFNISSHVRTKRGSNNSIYYIDDTVIGKPSGPGRITPESYYIIPKAKWSYNPITNKIEANGSVHTYFYTAYGDMQEANSYARIQIMLVKNGEIFNGYTTNFLVKYGEKGGIVYGNRTTQEEFIDYYKTFTFELPIDMNLSGVSIVSQGFMMGCFNVAPNGKTVALSYAKDVRIPFNVSIPAPEPIAPKTPNNLVVDETTIELSWDSSENAKSYNIYRKKDNAPWILIATTTSANYRDFSVIKRPDIYTFYYKVNAVDDGVTSHFSNVVSTMGNTYY